MHFKYSDFIGRTKTIFHCPKHPVSRITIPFKIQHSINHMFEYPWAGHYSFFGHMPHQKNSNRQALGQLHKCCRRLADLRYTSWCRRNLFSVHRLYGINHNNIRSLLLNHSFDYLQTGLTQQQNIFFKFSQTIRSQLNLLHRFLTGYIQYLLTHTA